MKITKSEIIKYAGVMSLGFFAWYYLLPTVKDFIDSHIKVNPIIIGVVGILVVLYCIDYNKGKK